MSASKVIKQIMLETDTSVKDLASMLGMKSSQILSNKLYRDTFTFDDYIKIVELMGCTVQTVICSNGKLYVNGNLPTDTAQTPEMPHTAASTKKTDKSPSRAEITPDPTRKQAVPHTPGHIHYGRYNQFTARDEKEIDTKRLLEDPRYQQEISDTFGGDMLLFLVDRARKQQGGGSV